MGEQMSFWQRAIRQCEDEVFQAKQELSMKKFPCWDSKPPDTTVQEENLRKAQAKLKYAQDKLETTRKWTQKFPMLVSEAYDGASRQLQATLESDLPRGLALLERRIDAAEKYVSLKAPSGPRDPAALPEPAAPAPPAPEPTA
jgi:hypothetical protein